MNDKAQRDDGGPAFPAHVNPGDQFTKMMSQDGMTLRDYFAAKAMQSAMVGAVLPDKSDREKWLPLMAEVVYEVADAMIAARKL